ncbi:chloride channel protein [Sulfurimonas sp.]|uniref:chloride channel protein n=1 Tax=Sulfurimonas sp. TaxID=2022749 RepID=UPI0025F3BA2A|nr:chloride channel protein [Sulfurimonas sp.]
MKKHTLEQITIFISIAKWLFLSSVIGIVIGASVTLFLKILQFSEQNQDTLPFPHYYLLPFALVATVWVVTKFAPDAEGHGTEKVIEAVHKKHGKIDIAVIPIKLLATVMTIFTGGSVGKEGPGAQIGAGMASFVSDLFHFTKEDRKKLVICGIGAGFASVFGTPIAGAIFGVEVLIIGLIRYDVLLPSFIAGFAAFTTAQYLGIEYTYFDINFHQRIALDFPLIVQVVLAGLFFGFISDFTITFIKRTHRTIKKIPINIYIKAFLGGSTLVLLSFVVGDQYFGLGVGTIDNALQPSQALAQNIPWYAFILKTLFTSITLASGGSGGVVTPIFYIGATSGNWFGSAMGGEHLAFFGALGFVSVLAGTTNSPIAATIMAMELFGIEMAHYAAISVVISFLMTGHRSVFPSQILAMKKSDMLDIKTGDSIEDTTVSILDEDINKIRDISKRLQLKREKRNEKPKSRTP